MDPLAPLLQSLAAEGRLRVWSLVISFFGDAVQPRGGRVAAARLQRLMERLGVEGGALRTALSRLAADGWLERDREGRNSFYRLSKGGVAEFAPASGRIYAPPRHENPGAWVLGLSPEPPEGALDLGGGAWLCADADRQPADGGITVSGQLMASADTLAARLLSDPHRAALERLGADIEALSAMPQDPLSAMAARVLLIHRWRRIVLRFPEIPQGLLPEGLDDARGRVAAVYARLLPPSEAWCDAEDPGFPAMPPPLPAMARRFRGPE
ncbi:hypothetical protein U879_16130 [Defluviimonas sp. 20V17]|uniref:Phenylacetic acid degradation operon negative regulatory protein n=1 Tax=Allgaiera indica TaxID=765699 RepID=A0AAN4UR06_9RHOB|nr:PaaX family transcriptional regulator C-terminal domain-containing protein [Allgaiera indica]KDB02721.1 hypothetical protein U879_16130 [Defluviimonas sp. 20V17]GHE01734.1 phenylacetic acid degradation operon negative regulatory protein [Allgaiera indica]SDW94158.1 transcriptional regulator, PaaX family [Allgaiera indica]